MGDYGGGGFYGDGGDSNFYGGGGGTAATPSPSKFGNSPASSQKSVSQLTIEGVGHVLDLSCVGFVL